MPNYSKNQLLRHDDRIIRVLAVDTDVLTVNCLKRTMPLWMSASELRDWEPCDESVLPSPETPICNLEDLTPEQRKVMRERFTQIAPVLPFIHKQAQRSAMIAQMAELNNVSKQTIRKYLCLYLTYQRMEVLAPPAQQKERELSADQKNFRWALNKYYYTQRKHSLPTAYNLMLKEKYTDAAGQLMPGYPPFHRFKYTPTKRQNQIVGSTVVPKLQRKFWNGSMMPTLPIICSALDCWRMNPIGMTAMMRERS